MNRKMLMVFAIVTLTPAAAAAQGGQTGAQGQATATAAAQAATPEARIQAAMQAAAQAQIPASLLERKVQEGRAKQVPMDRVAAAVEARLEALLRARDALNRADARVVTEGELLVAAEALRAGVSEQALIRITREAPGERRAVATAVLTDLVRLGYENGDAFARVNAALSASPEALVNLRAEAAASLRARGLLSTDITGGLTGGL
ncbi:MAG TPA: hypothetical protein VMM12_01950 [Longimicrobiales bacterium]|nr:hypothetical protein [Longimicrobiales bacterium]